MKCSKRFSPVSFARMLLQGLVLSLIISPLFPIHMVHSQPFADQQIQQADLNRAYQARCDSLIDYYANRIQIDSVMHGGVATEGGYFDIAAKLYRNQDLNYVKARLDSLLANPRGDMFWMYPVTLVAYLAKDRLPAEYNRKIRNAWRTYTPYRGDTENHWAMYYSTLYLMTQMYPDQPGSEWYNGKSSRENHQEARDYLINWMDLTTTKGQGEFDSPHYMAVYIAPMAELYAFAEDPAMRKRAGMMLDYLLADFAVESIEGLYTGAFSRIYPRAVLTRWNDSSTGFSWLLFGNTAFKARQEAMILALSGYEPPPLLHHMATDRNQSYVHKELKRTRHRIRYSEKRNARVYKYMYMTPDYAMGSIQGGLLQPIQQHTWEIMWRTGDSIPEYNVMYTHHPYSSGYELAMYFPEEYKLLTQHVLSSKGTYDSPDKLTGGSPYEQVFQNNGALIALYDIPEGTRFPHIHGIFPKSLDPREEHESGWIFTRASDLFMAYYPLAGYEWQEEEHYWRLYSEILQNGAVIQAARAGDFQSFQAFKDEILSLSLKTQTDPAPSVQFTTLSGNRMEFTYGETPSLNGEKVDYENWPLFEGPFLHAEEGSQRLEMQYGNMHRLLDFQNLTVREWIEQ